MGGTNSWDRQFAFLVAFSQPRTAEKRRSECRERGPQQGDEPLIIGHAFGMELERPDNLGAIR